MLEGQHFSGEKKSLLVIKWFLGPSESIEIRLDRKVKSKYAYYGIWFLDHEINFNVFKSYRKLHEVRPPLQKFNSCYAKMVFHQ